MPHAAFLELPQDCAGALVVGDVHGRAQAFARFAAMAESRRLFLVALGDLVDRGPDSPGALRCMRRLVEAGKGLFLRGNHDDKLFRALSGRRIARDAELARTLEQLHAAADGRALEDWFRAIYPEMPFVLRLGDTVLVHGGLLPDMLPPADAFRRRQRALALYGETTGERDCAGKPVRLYRWLDALPAGLLVIAGHDPLSDEILYLREGRQGARLLHLDSGAGRGGPLSAAMLEPDGRLAGSWQLRPGAREPIPCAVVPWRERRARGPVTCAPGPDLP